MGKEFTVRKANRKDLLRIAEITSAVDAAENEWYTGTESLG